MRYLLLLCLLVPNSYAKMLYSVGTFVPYFQKAQVSDSGSRQFFDLNPYASVGTLFPLVDAHFFVPEIGLTYYLENAKKTSKRIIFLHYDFAYVINDFSIFRYGLTNYWYTISGDGGEVRMRNGSGYANFDAPSKSVTTYFTTLDLGYEFFFNQDLSLRFDLNMMSMTDQENSAYNYLLTINFYR